MRSEPQVPLLVAPRFFRPRESSHDRPDVLGQVDEKRCQRRAPVSRVLILQTLRPDDLRLSLPLNGGRGVVDLSVLRSAGERRHQVICGDDCITKGQVDALSADRRHRMSGISDQQHPRRCPKGAASDYYPEMDRPFELSGDLPNVFGQPCRSGWHNSSARFAVSAGGLTTLGIINAYCSRPSQDV